MVPVTNLPSHLPDLCLENIFKRVPLHDLLGSVREVCTNWHRLVPCELRRRQELVIFGDYNHDVETIRNNENPFGSELIEHVRRDDGSPWLRLRSLDRISFNALLVPGVLLTEGFTSALMDTLPNITHLTVVQYYIPEHSIISVLVQLVRLLNHYRDRMFSLKLVFSSVYRRKLMTNCTTLFNSINQLQSLRHLTLNVHFPDIDLTFFPILSILSQLESFASEYTGAPWHMHSIRQFATGNVRIDWTPHMTMEEMNALDQQLTTKITSVDVNNDLTVTSYDNLRLFGARFLSISRLSLFNRTMPMTMLARCLSPLAQLIHLEIYGTYFPNDEQPEPDYVQLPSVRLLSLRIITRSHLDTSQLHLSQIFPNLQVLSLDQTIESCDQCEYNLNPNPNRIDPDRVKHCIRLSRQPFRLCAHLHTIKHDGWAMDLKDLFPRDLIPRDQF